MKKTTIYRQQKDENLFEEELTIDALSTMGNPLEQLSSLVDFEMFRPALEDVLVKKDCKSTAGRPQYDAVLMFKVIFLQRYYGLGDKQIQYQIIDRTSFRQFLGIRTVDDVPDEKTVWNVKNQLSQSGTFDKLFTTFREFLSAKGLSFNEGKIIDASFVEAPKQRNTHEENKQIKSGNGDSLWNDKPHKKCHKDTDARYTKKRGDTHYGYKAHVKADKKTKIIETYATTDTSVHDSNIIKPLIEEGDKGQDLYLDAGYEAKDDVVRECGMNPIICEKVMRRSRPVSSMMLVCSSLTLLTSKTSRMSSGRMIFNNVPYADVVLFFFAILQMVRNYLSSLPLYQDILVGSTASHPRTISVEPI